MIGMRGAELLGTEIATAATGSACRTQQTPLDNQSNRTNSACDQDPANGDQWLNLLTEKLV